MPFDEVPREAEHEAQVQWLYDWWERIDTWISENRPGGVAVPEVVAVPEDETAEPVGELPDRRTELRARAAVITRPETGSWSGIHLPPTQDVTEDGSPLAECVGCGSPGVRSS